jgi:hypothetical protein
MDARSGATLSARFSGESTSGRGTVRDRGTYFLVVSGLRTAAEQDALYAQGRIAPGHIVTNSKGGLSMHNYGLAVAAVPFLTGDPGALNWTENTPQFQAMVAARKRLPRY